MMFFTRDQVNAAIAHVNRYASTEVTYNETNILVISESSEAVNEFEAQLAASTLVWDGEDTNGRILLDNLVNIQGVRTEFRKRYNDEWQARYSIVAK